jgi:uncharacterized protein (AIM24 family)
MIRVKGERDLSINTFRALEKLVLDLEEELVVDNFHLAAFSESCKYEAEKFGILKSTIVVGEGLIVRIKGPGEVCIQMKNPAEFAMWIRSVLEPYVRSRAR